MLNVRFPTDISFGSVGGPEYVTDVVKTRSGYEQRMFKKEHAQRRYNVAYAIKSLEQLERVRAFFMNARGRAIPFLFQDPLDHKAEKSLIGIGDGAQKTFKLVKVYGVGEAFTSRMIHYPLQETLQVFIDDRAITGFHFEKGVIVLHEAPAKNAKITASFSFDICARFDTDYLAERLDGHGYVSITDLPIVEVLENSHDG